jgi:hypothetical protein
MSFGEPDAPMSERQEIIGHLIGGFEVVDPEARDVATEVTRRNRNDGYVGLRPSAPIRNSLKYATEGLL